MAGMDKVAIHDLFGIQGLDVAWYGIIIASAIVIGVAVAVWQAKKRGYTSELIFDMMIIALPLAIIGARIYYVAFDWENFADDPSKIFKIWEGGIAIYGAVIGAVLGAFILARWRKFPLGRLLDIAVPGLILGQAIGRWGNFINREAFGMEITDPSLQFFPYGVFVDSQWVGGMLVENRWFMATFFYESMWDLGVFALLLWYAKRAKHDGNVFAMYMIGYGLGRLWIEGVRIQTLTMPGGLPVSQFLSLVIIIAGMVYILAKRKWGKPNVLYEGRYCVGWQEPETDKKAKKDKKAAKAKSAEAEATAEKSADKTEKAGISEKEEREKKSEQPEAAEAGKEAADADETEEKTKE